MDNKPILYGIIGLLLGVGIATYVASNSVNTGNTGMMSMMGMRAGGNMMDNDREVEEMMGDLPAQAGMGMGSSMNQMMESLEGKSGEEFDKAFIDAMTVHHQGAIEMAQEALKSAGREEIKKMASDIITAQTNEIEMMRGWKTQWGY